MSNKTVFVIFLSFICYLFLFNFESVNSKSLTLLDPQNKSINGSESSSITKYSRTIHCVAEAINCSKQVNMEWRWPESMSISGPSLQYFCNRSYTAPDSNCTMILNKSVQVCFNGKIVDEKANITRLEMNLTLIKPQSPFYSTYCIFQMDYNFYKKSPWFLIHLIEPPFAWSIVAIAVALFFFFILILILLISLFIFHLTFCIKKRRLLKENNFQKENEFLATFRPLIFIYPSTNNFLFENAMKQLKPLDSFAYHSGYLFGSRSFENDIHIPDKHNNIAFVICVNKQTVNDEELKIFLDGIENLKNKRKSVFLLMANSSSKSSWNKLIKQSSVGNRLRPYLHVDANSSLSSHVCPAWRSFLGENFQMKWLLHHLFADKFMWENNSEINEMHVYEQNIQKNEGVC